MRCGRSASASPRLDAQLLLAEATGLSRATLVARPEQPVDAAAARRFATMLRRRLRREPIAYVLGRKGFRRIELEVDGRVLVPRPETEMLVELALEVGPRTVLDVGTGSGAIALAVADELPAAAVTATDVSADALDVARANAARLGLGDRVGVRARLAAGRGRRVRPAAREPSLRRRARLARARARDHRATSRAAPCSPAPTASTRSAG